MIDIARLGGPMRGDDCRAEPFSEALRQPLKTACAEDGDIWQIYANNFGPDGFDKSIDAYTSAPRNRTFVLFDGDELEGMSSFLGIDEGREVLEIGGTYYRPHLRGTGFNRRVLCLGLKALGNLNHRQLLGTRLRESSSSRAISRHSMIV